MRDMIYSLMYRRRLSFDQLLRKGMIHQILANDLFWRSHPGVLVQRYEAIVDDPLTAVVQFARHLGVGVTRHEAAEIADEFSLESNQRRISALRGRLEQQGSTSIAARGSTPAIPSRSCTGTTCGRPGRALGKSRRRPGKGR